MPCLILRISYLAEVVAGYDADPYSRKLLQELSVNAESRPPNSLRNGVIHIANRVWVGSNKPLQHKIVTALHSSVLGGHSGFPVAYSRTQKLFC